MIRSNKGLVIPKDATHILMVCDTFNYEDYPVFCFGEEDCKIKQRRFDRNMQRINKTIKLSADKTRKV